MYVKCFKRLFDIIISLLGIVLLSWLFLLCSVMILLDDGRPVLFRQKRFGKEGSFFYLHKFRSMKAQAPHDVPTHLMTNPERYETRVGKFLRRSSLDELPQLFDILMGHMSVIGPRPALWNQTDLICLREAHHANQFKPGLTGLAQISGRDMLTLDEKARLDGIYCDSMRKGGFTAFKMDLKCFFKTIGCVLRREGLQ